MLPLLDERLERYVIRTAEYQRRDRPVARVAPTRAARIAIAEQTGPQTAYSSGVAERDREAVPSREPYRHTAQADPMKRSVQWPWKVGDVVCLGVVQRRAGLSGGIHIANLQDELAAFTGNGHVNRPKATADSGCDGLRHHLIDRSTDRKRRGGGRHLGRRRLIENERGLRDENAERQDNGNCRGDGTGPHKAPP